MFTQKVHIIGGGLAGCEAAWQLAKRGHKVLLYERKPLSYSPAHKSPHLAELVCSNSLRAASIENAVGLLKEEMRRLGSLFMEAADATAVPAGKALAVDRDAFSKYIENRLMELSLITIIREEVTEIPSEGIVILAPGPLPLDALARAIEQLTGSSYLYFYDAISPIVEAHSINMRRVFKASRYGEGTEEDGDYINCPLSEEEYLRFREEVLRADKMPLREFELPIYLESCLPIEVLAERGVLTLAHGPMKPVGLIDPRTGKQPFAVVQLRKENREGTMYNMVGFQTRLTWPEQKRIFRMIPGLENAEFARLGSIHRNTFINSPALLTDHLQLKKQKRIYFAGQISGVEGYVESAAMGGLAGIFVAAEIEGFELPTPPRTTAHGALIHYLTTANPKNFQPMNVNFGLFPPLPRKISHHSRGKFYSDRALKDWQEWLTEIRP
ncbi:MAG: methylenetetrahydrofolate--tRNA-(uracil(54)-C(5))-methyltransferase (FADH(2)-oxidizing) TrmFO [Syntrophales bacterium]|nr:methylenetetrahydrofolate--tRNA-(uracil(54)-C(5))-methyltransferase (FADH(2)-oxidizing) TrmFO [Syntrophales bacterium]